MWEKLKKIFRYVSERNIPVYAAHAGYFLVLSVFPMLVLLLSLLRHTGIAVQTLTDGLRGFLPEALLPSAKKLILSTYQNTSGTVISLSAVAALWSASRGIYGLRKGLNAIYHVEESRGYFYTRAVSVVYTVLFLGVLLLTLVLSVFGNSIAQHFPVSFFADVVDLRFIVLLLTQTALFTAMFMVLPNRKNRFWDSLPGAVFASVGWLGFSKLYSVYMEHFTGYTNIFGSVYAVAVSMLWLYCCLSIVFYGGVLNYYLQSGKKSR